MKKSIFIGTEQKGIILLKYVSSMRYEDGNCIIIDTSGNVISFEYKEKYYDAGFSIWLEYIIEKEKDQK